MRWIQSRGKVGQREATISGPESSGGVSSATLNQAGLHMSHL